MGLFKRWNDLQVQKGVNDVTIKSKEEHFIDINTSIVNKTDNQNIDVQEISILLSNFNILSPNSTMDQLKLAEFQAEQATLTDDITDILDENNLEDNIDKVEDIHSFISWIKQLQSK